MSQRPGTPTCTGASGGQGEIGGNDFSVFNLDAGTIMHELGHTLNLHHGGFEDTNCKPNFVSIMNYDLQSGIPRVGGGMILDYSPPRILINGSTRGAAPLGNLVETNLLEPTVLDPSDGSNRFVFVSTPGTKITNTLNVAPNWNQDVDPPLETAPATNINTAGPNGRPTACGLNTSNNETLQGADDWTFVSLAFRQFGDSASGGVNVDPDPENEPTTEELLAIGEAINTTDLGVTKSDSPDPVFPGGDIVYTLVVTNHGPNPATSVKLTDTLPAQVDYVSNDSSCGEASGIVTCALGDMASGATRTVKITVNVPAALVYGPDTITNTAKVENLAGPDSDSGNNTATESTQIACTNCTPDGFGGTVTVTVDANVTADLNPASPTCTEADGAVGDDLCAKDAGGNYLYFSWDKSNADPSLWKAIWDLGGKKLVIGDNATVTVKTVGAPGGNNQKSPGIVIKGQCELVILGDVDNNGKAGSVIVQSTNQAAGDILLRFNGNITIDGVVRNQVTGTQGRPGKITVASCCGDVVVGTGRVETVGVAPGGSDIEILTCCRRGYGGAGGDIVINGTVRALNTYGVVPTINIVAFVGAMTIDGRADLGDEVLAGTHLPPHHRRLRADDQRVTARQHQYPGARRRPRLRQSHPEQEPLAVRGGRHPLEQHQQPRLRRRHEGDLAQWEHPGA